LNCAISSSVTNDPRLRSEAIAVIQSIHDPKLDKKIEAERKRAQKQGRELRRH